MVKTQADGEDNQHADDLGPRVKAMYPGAFVEVEKDIHNKLKNGIPTSLSLLAMTIRHC